MTGPEGSSLVSVHVQVSGRILQSQRWLVSPKKGFQEGQTENQLRIWFYLRKSHSSFLAFFPPLPSFLLRQYKFLEVDLASGKQAASGLESKSPPSFATTTKTRRPHYVEPSFAVHCLKWDAVSALLFLPSNLSCPPRQLVSPLALLPTPTLLIILNIYTSVSFFLQLCSLSAF